MYIVTELHEFKAVSAYKSTCVSRHLCSPQQVAVDFQLNLIVLKTNADNYPPFQYRAE